MSKQRVPAVEGWFTLDDAPQLLGVRCTTCGTYVFPARVTTCPSPDCLGDELVEARLSRTGTVWSYTRNHYAPPAPYVAPDPFEPYVVAAVELADEQMVVLGQVTSEAAFEDLSIGAQVELVLDTLYEDDEHEYVVWKWRPVATAAASEAAA